MPKRPTKRLPTVDMEFAEHVRRHRLPHAGIVYIPNRMLADEQTYFAEVAAAFVKGGCRGSRFENESVLGLRVADRFLAHERSRTHRRSVG